MATTMAEFLGGTLGIYLLFGIPLKYAGIITCLVTFLIIYLQKYGQRMVEIVITALVAIISVSYAIEVFLAKPDWTSVALHTLVPSLPIGQAVLIAVGMLGATVMPHVIFLHSQLVQDRYLGMSIEEKKRHLKMEKIDVTIAMNIAFIVNASMVIVSAAVFYSKGLTVNSIEQAHQSLTPLLGALSSGAFGIALPAAIIPLMIITSKNDLMGDFTNKKLTKYAGWFITTLIIGLNIVLLYLLLTGSV